MRRLALACTVATSLFAAPRLLIAQQPDHSAHASHGARGAASTTPTRAGQDAFAAIAEIVRILEGDSTTDWSKVDLEALRRHLVMMNDVVLRASAAQTSVPGGARMDITGEGSVVPSIRTMLAAHATQLEALGTYRATVEEIPRGVRLTVTAADRTDGRTAAKIRALGFAGLLAVGDHHAPHHLAIARGAGAAAHSHKH